ncbi:MAG TPA: hypothetical protein VKD25_10140 [Burkholderiales bacterium]|nr:hypothetical protein [Burkholderiales bacterium]
MSFDIDGTIKDMGNAAAAVLAGEAPKIRVCLDKALEDEKEALQMIADARLVGDITAAEMKEQIADEREALKVALLACKVKGKVAAQKAANAALKVLEKAVRTALKAV